MIMHADDVHHLHERDDHPYLIFISSSHNRVSKQITKQYRWAYFFAWRRAI